MKKKITLELSDDELKALGSVCKDKNIKLFNTKLEKLLIEKNLSVNEISKTTGISRPTITRLIKGTSTGIQFKTLEVLCKYFHKTASEMIELLIKEK